MVSTFRSLDTAGKFLWPETRKQPSNDTIVCRPTEQRVCLQAVHGQWVSVRPPKTVLRWVWPQSQSPDVGPAVEKAAADFRWSLRPQRMALTQSCVLALPQRRDHGAHQPLPARFATVHFHV